MYSIFEQLLQKNNLSTYKVSKDTGIAQSVFSSWKSGKSTPKLDKLQILADYFGVTLDFLTGSAVDQNTHKADQEYTSTSEKQFKLLARKADNLSEEQRKILIKHFEDTMDMYLQAKGIELDKQEE